MNIIKFILSKNYRENLQRNYSSNLAKRIDEDYASLEKIYSIAMKTVLKGAA